MKKILFLGLLASLLLVQIVNASDIVSCTVTPQEVDLSKSDQVTVTIQLNNTKNETVTDTVEISFPTNYLSCVGGCTKNVTIASNSTGSTSFNLKASSATNEKQSITVTKPTSYTCQSISKIIAAKDTTAPTVGSVSPISVTSGKSTTFSASVSDDVGVTACNFTYSDKTYTATVSNNIASYTATLSEGSYSAYFKCSDAAGNTGTGAAVTIASAKPQLSATIALPKTTYYPAENFEPKVTVKDQDGKIVIDASVSGKLTYGTNSKSLSFFYSALCDCYKAWYWFDEGTLPNNYTLTVTASRTNYQSANATATFTLIKPTLKMSMSTDKSEYNPGDSIKTTVETKDSLGNIITNAYLTGEIRDATTGTLVTLIYPWLKEGVYYYEYYIGSESVGKSYTVSVKASWKEQSVSDSKTVSVTKRGLNADFVLEKDVLVPGDILQGKIKVFDKSGNIVTDAKINVEIKNPAGDYFKWLSTVYKDGFYEIDKWKVEDWVMVGKYTLNVKIDKSGETVTQQKTIEVTKEKLDVQVILDQTSYAPGDRIYIKILVTYPNGSIVPNAFIGGEIFPLTQEVVTETTKITGKATIVSAGAATAVSSIGEPTKVCRIYIHPAGPLYYKGEYVQRYYVDDAYVPNECPSGTYVLRLKIGAQGYADTEFSKEFSVALHKLLLETGFKIDSKPGAVDLSIYAEVKDDKGNVVPNVNIKGFLHPFDEKVGGCVKQIYLGYEEFTKRYTTRVFLGKGECPDGKYLLEISTSRSSYETATVEQAVEIKYAEGYEYNVVVPSSIGGAVCKEVSCGPDCITKVCETPRPSEQCFEEVTDKTCINDCTNKSTTTEQAVSKGETAEFNAKDCIKSCVKKVPCKGSSVTTPNEQEMLNKLNQIQAEIKKTGEQINIVTKMLQAIINFFNSIISIFGGGKVSQITASNQTTAISPT